MKRINKLKHKTNTAVVSTKRRSALYSGANFSVRKFISAGLLAVGLIPMIAFSGVVQMEITSGGYGDTEVRVQQ